MMKRKVVLITDCTDVALLEMRGAIFSNASNDNFEIEPIVNVENFSIQHAAFLTRLIAEIYPPGTIIAVIVNPSQRRPERIIGRTKYKNLIFEGPNTGAFGWLIEDFGVEEVYEIYDPGFVPFGGKYVHSPAIGKAASGTPINELGSVFNKQSILPSPIQEGTIVHIDNFGNAKLKMNFKDENGALYKVLIDDKMYKFLYWTRMMERNDGEYIIYPGSSFDLIELGIVRGNLAKELNLKVGDIVKVERVLENV
ncbi:S-adenosylmethionine hydrolase [Melghiribacillus thermohalophilus]|uniref:S-adenosylmethionine hydrolase n=2 Tax=Melghiribacillus thermohalophilus TaxID=1324956 RepID=A0A4R3MPP4_9BACI|nr:S-adenosylmethionine hydrolase [Melghiribacillus thermohalophilus]